MFMQKPGNLIANTTAYSNASEPNTLQGQPSAMRLPSFMSSEGQGAGIQLTRRCTLNELVMYLLESQTASKGDESFIIVAIAV